MKTISAGLAQHLAGEMTKLATCWQITRRDGVVLGFTDHVRDLEVDSVTYRAASGYTRTAIRSTADLAVDNLDVESVFSDDGITEEDLRTGRYDFAEVRMFLVNYENLSQGIVKLRPHPRRPAAAHAVRAAPPVQANRRRRARRHPVDALHAPPAAPRDRRRPRRSLLADPRLCRCRRLRRARR